ncbi:MAG: malto-oligosyltrehalose trehalohydrolase [Phycisphaeraceae bacterium]|nr:malto-oligosyltrehalose trehalohydrolase [Phycisphaeraceae bacterium]
MKTELPRLGAIPESETLTRFCVWAPKAMRLGLHLPDAGRSEWMKRDQLGYHSIVAEAPPGTLYQFEFEDSRLRPDPASRAQPFGVHGPSMVERVTVPRALGFQNPTLAHHVIYELHTGTFTPEGTFQSAIARLDDLRDLGITAVELMPVSQFPGNRNWGYDGVGPFAAQWSYGGLNGLRKLVDACHSRGLAVILDVVYNHLGPEGNYLSEFGQYFTDRYQTPWGAALNFGGPESDQVREYFIQNALHWVIDCGIDGLRLDAVHAIIDHTAKTFIEELAERVHDAAEAIGRRALLIAESSDNDPKLVRSADRGGAGLDGCWNDDFHHAIRCALTGENRGYYKPFGSVDQIAKAVRDRFVFTGEYSSSHLRRHGAWSRDVPHGKLVVFTQNHDQVGNRPHGDRLDASAGEDGAKLAAAMVLLSPFTPLLWMGEEYGEVAPFQYFVSHTDPGLIEAVRKGRRAEFAELHDGSEPPDPQDEATFERSKLDWSRRVASPRLAMYRELLRLRRELDIPSLAASADAIGWEDKGCLAVFYGMPARVVVAANFGAGPCNWTLPAERVPPSISWRIALDTASRNWSRKPNPPGAEAALQPAEKALSITVPAKSAIVLVSQSEPE